MKHDAPCGGGRRRRPLTRRIRADVRYELLRLLPPRPEEPERLRFGEPLPPLPFFDEPSRDERDDEAD